MKPDTQDEYDDGEIVRRVRGILGARLTALIAGVAETRSVRAWADGAEAPPTAVMARLRIAYRVAAELARVEGPEVAQAWFMGMNPNLSDRSPARLLRDRGPEVSDEVMGTALQFLAESGASEAVPKEDGDDDSNRGEKGGWQSAEEASAYYASIGPWVTAKAAAEYCNISEEELFQWTESRRVLGVEFADGKYYYQAQQFKDGGPVVGLDRILAALSPSFVAPASQAGWFAGRAYIGMDLTRWDLLRLGDVKLILDWAQADAEWVTRP